MTGLRSGKGYLYVYDNPTMTLLPDSIRFVKNAFKKHALSSSSFNHSMIEHAPLLALVDLKYQRWCDRKPLLLMKLNEDLNEEDKEKYKIIHEVLFDPILVTYCFISRTKT